MSRSRYYRNFGISFGSLGNSPVLEAGGACSMRVFFFLQLAGSDLKRICYMTLGT